ncbi:hypothetical protein [Streptomyces aureocirculatus]|uniref:hypothetical protein n=1 Tax=Streptomyces aureocirculatus TaxID=67275 RepID=UPI00099D6ACF|nr:hypothetical protein [Streptomyces aureocirculatus]
MHPRPAVNPRLLALLGVVAVAVLLPLAGASAGPVLRQDAKTPEQPVLRDDAKSPERPARAAAPATDAPVAPATDAPPAPGDVPPPAETTARCGPELSSPKGVEAQTCVLTQAGETWARTYYRNATGESIKAVLSLMGPAGRTLRMHCPVGAEDEPTACDTPRERTAGAGARYSAVAEFAAEHSDALLLRSGSNSAASTGS